MTKDFTAGAGYFREGLRLIWRPGLRRFVLIPVIVNLLIFIAIAVLGSRYFSTWVDRAVAWLPDWLSFIAWILWLLFAALFLLVWVYGFVFLSNLLGSPFYGLLSEKVEELLTGQAPDNPMTFKTMLMTVPRSLWREFQKLGYYLPRLLAIFVLGFLPFVQLAAPVVSALFIAWMMAVQFVDFPADNRGVAFPLMRRSLARRRILASSFGGLVFLATLVPILNLVAMPAAVAGGTALWIRELREDNQSK